MGVFVGRELAEEDRAGGVEPGGGGGVLAGDVLGREAQVGIARRRQRSVDPDQACLAPSPRQRSVPRA